MKTKRLSKHLKKRLIPLNRGKLVVMIAQWDSSLSVLPVAKVQFPTMAEYLKDFYLADHTCAMFNSSGSIPSGRRPLDKKPSVS